MFGLSPHGRGKHSLTSLTRPLPGLSPHGRGKPLPTFPVILPTRSIPARAGETRTPQGRPLSAKVYPRTGGGNGESHPGPEQRHGLSPHGRGKRRVTAAGLRRVGSIPARAGETYMLGRGFRSAVVYPRTGGGNPQFPANMGYIDGLSPHGRGKHGCVGGDILCPGSIPARAGETIPVQLSFCHEAVYPRTGGGNSLSMGL